MIVVSETTSNSEVRETTPTRREHLWAAIVLLIATAICFSRLLQHPTDILVGPHNGGQNDVTTHVLSFRPLPVFGLRNVGELPLWNPWSMAGVPWLGNPQSGAFYPPNWLYLVLPSTICANWLVFLHHWWAGYGVYLLGRRFGLSWIAALGAGICFLGAPYMMAQTCEGHVSQVCLMAWSPWLWLAYERIRLGLRGGIPCAAFVMSMAFFCGHVQELFYLVLFFSVCSVWDAWFSRQPSGMPRWRIFPKWMAAGALTGGLVLIEFLPVWSYLRHAARAAGITVAQASYGSLEPASLWQLLDPLAYGGPQNSLDPKSYWWGSYWETLLYFGVGPLLLAVWGLITSPRRFPALRIAGLALVAILFSFGDDTPVFPLLHQFVPGIGMFRAPMRALFHASLGIALLSGFGLDQIIRAARSTECNTRVRTQLVWGLLTGLFALLSIWAMLNVPPFATSSAATFPHIRWSMSWGYALGVAMMAFMMLQTPTKAAVYAAACLAIFVADLGLHARAITRTIPLSQWRQRNAILEQVARSIGPYRLLAPQSLVSDREAWQRGISKVQAYEPVPLVRWGEFFAALFPTKDPAVMLTGFHSAKSLTGDAATPELIQYRKPLINLLGVKYAAVSGHDEKPPPGWRLVKRDAIPREVTHRDGKLRGSKYSLFENQEPLPRAFVAHQVTSVRSNREALDALKTLDPRKSVIVGANFPELGSSDRKELTPVEIVRYAPTRVTLRTELPEAGVLCLTDFHYPGWHATDNGKPIAIYPGNFAFRAIPLDAGKHEVTLQFSPPGMKLGGIASLFAWMVLILSVLRVWKVPSAAPVGGSQS